LTKQAIYYIMVILVNKFMKKIFFLFLIIFVAGCTTTTPKGTITEKDAPKDTASYNESEVVKRIDEIRHGAKPIVKPTGKTKKTSQQPAKGQNKIQLENLVAQYNQAWLKTNLGDIKVEFYTDEAPITINNFLNLAKKEFYNNTKFHRVIKDFMIQGGDPLSKNDDWSDDGTGGPGYRFQDEINSHKLVRGSLAMANSGPNTNGSQFFIITATSTPWLDGKHTNFGYVVEGMETVDKIEAVEVNAQSHPIEDVVVEKVELIKE